MMEKYVREYSSKMDLQAIRGGAAAPLFLSMPIFIFKDCFHADQS